MHEADPCEDLLTLRQLELRVMAHEMALIAKRLGANESTDPAQIQQLELELHRARTDHAVVWRHVEEEQRQRRTLALIGFVGLGAIGLALIATSGDR